MNIQEKILYLRKKAGYSQEALAEKLGVSRQAVSKWENGDAEPELSKIRLLKELFGVSTDWLVSEDGPKEKVTVNLDQRISNSALPTWVEDAPGIIGKLLKRFGWLLGLFISFIGLMFAGFATLGRVMSTRMFSGYPMIENSPVTLLTTFMQYFGLILVIVGFLVAVLLFQYRNKDRL